MAKFLVAKKKLLSPELEEENIKDVYTISDEDKELRAFVYAEYAVMRDVHTQKYTEFNDRTLIQFIDDNEKRLNAYVPSRESQNKEEWQANFVTQLTRNKVKAFASSASKNPPDIKIIARNSKSELSPKRAEIMSMLLRSSYTEYGNNPEKVIFNDAWAGLGNGTVIKYDGWIKTKNKVKTVKSFNQITGEVEYDEKEMITEDCPIEIDVPLKNFFIKSAYIPDVQKQSAVAWGDCYDKERFNFEFGHYPNAKYVKTSNQLISDNESQTFFGNEWADRINKDTIEVFRYYNKSKDLYIIMANGVILLKSPLLWGNKRKRYPFAKSGFEPFANLNFFWLNSLPNILMSLQDLSNSLNCSMVDKVYRSLKTPLLIGATNKDLFDLEDEYVDQDTKIYVDDVNQVKPMPTDGITASEFNMYKLVVEMAESASLDSVQSGATGSGSTAREVVIANERAEQLKNTFYMFLKDLWVQKYDIRILNIIMNYGEATIDSTLSEEDASTYKKYRSFTVRNQKLSSGKQGNIQINIVPKGEQSRPSDLAAKEDAYEKSGQPTEIIEIDPETLDDWDYEIDVVTESLYNHNKSMDMALVSEKVAGVAKLFPNIFMQASDEFFKEYIEGYGDNADKYLSAMEQPQAALPGAAQGAMQGAPTQPASQMGAMPPQMGNLGGL